MGDKEKPTSSTQEKDKEKGKKKNKDKDLDDETKNLKQFKSILISLLASNFAFMVGYELGWASPAQMKLEDGEQGYIVSEDEFSLVGSIFPLGAAVSCIPTGITIDIYGRKPILIIMGILGIIGWVLMAFCKYYIALIIGRVIHGIATGSFCTCVPLYISEIAHKKIRGALASTFQLQITIGILIAYIAGNWLDADWLAILGLIIAIVTTLLFLFAPESPVTLIKKGKEEKAELTMKRLRGPEYDIGPEMNELNASKKELEENPVSFKQAFMKKTTQKGLLYAGGLMFFQQLSGINAVIFYTVSIFDAADAGLDANLSTIIVGVIQVIATVISTLLVDRLGRILLLTPSAVFMAISTFGLGVYFFMKDSNKNVDDLGWLPLTAVCLFIIMFSFGFGPVPWCIVGEIFPADIRGKCASLAATVNWLLAFIVTMTFPLLKNAIGAGTTFWIFTIITIGGLLFVSLLLPETKGKSLEEIQKALE